MKVPKTDRLVFRAWKPEDLPLARALWGDPEVARLITAQGRFSDVEIESKLRSEIALWEEHGIQYWPIFESETGEFVGCCGLRPWICSNRPGPELGFHLLVSKWGKGYATEAARGAICFAFQELRHAQLQAGHHPQNAGSKNVLLKLGFKYVEDVFYKPTGLHHPAYQLSPA